MGAVPRRAVESAVRSCSLGWRSSADGAPLGRRRIARVGENGIAQLGRLDGQRRVSLAQGAGNRVVHDGVLEQTVLRWLIDPTTRPRARRRLGAAIHPEREGLGAGEI